MSSQKTTPRRRPPSRTGRKGKLAEARRAEAIRLALCLTPPTSIASHLGISVDRVHRLLAEPETQARLELARRTAFTDAIAELRQLTRRAVSVIAEELERRTHPSVRLRAAVEAISLAGADAPKRMNVHASLSDATDEELNAELFRIQVADADEHGREVPAWMRERAQPAIERHARNIAALNAGER